MKKQFNLFDSIFDTMVSIIGIYFLFKCLTNKKCRKVLIITLLILFSIALIFICWLTSGS